MRRIAAAIVLTLTLAACASSSPDAGGGDSGASDASEDTPEFMLATLDAGSPIDEDDPSVAEFAEALDSLEATCSEGRSSIGDFAVKSQELLKDDIGKDVTLDYVLDQVRASIPSGSPEMPCADVFAAWVTLEEGAS